MSPELDTPQAPEELPSSTPENEPASPSPSLGSDAKEHIQNQLGRFKDGQRKASQPPTGAAENPGQTAAVNARGAAAQAEQRAQKQASQVATKAARQASHRLVALARSYIAKNPVVWAAIGIALFILLAIAILFTLFGFSGKSGSGPAIYASTEAEKQADIQVLALSADPSASAEVVINKANQLKARLATAREAAGKKYAGNEAKKNQAITAIDELTVLLDQVKNVADNKEERSKVIATLNEKLTAFGKNFEELIFGAGNCADLKEFIDSKQFVIREGPNAAYVVRGLLKNKHNGVSPLSHDLCGTLVYALRGGFSISTGSFSWDHGVCAYDDCSKNDVSAHACGAAIDIQYINNERVSPSSQQARKFLEYLKAGGKDKKIFVQQAISPFAELYIHGNAPGSQTDSFHQDHVHLSGRAENPSCMKTGKP